MMTMLTRKNKLKMLPHVDQVASMEIRPCFNSVWRLRAKFSVLPSAAKPAGSQNPTGACNNMVAFSYLVCLLIHVFLVLANSSHNSIMSIMNTCKHVTSCDHIVPACLKGGVQVLSCNDVMLAFKQSGRLSRVSSHVLLEPI